MAEQAFWSRFFRVPLVAIVDARRKGRIRPRNVFTRLLCYEALVAGSRSGVLGKYMDIGDDANTGQLNINGLDFKRLCFFWPSLPVFQSQVRVSLWRRELNP